MTIVSFISAFRQNDGSWRYSVNNGEKFVSLYRLPAIPRDAWKKAEGKPYQACTKRPLQIELVGVKAGTKNPNVLFGTAVSVTEAPEMSGSDMDAIIA